MSTPTNTKSGRTMQARGTARTVLFDVLGSMG
jgi:hypothetical protein